MHLSSRSDIKPTIGVISSQKYKHQYFKAVCIIYNAEEAVSYKACYSIVNSREHSSTK